MNSLIEIWPALAGYQPALFAMAALSLALLVQGFLAGALGLAKSDEVPGRPLKGGHGDRSFRVLRTYANSTENMPAFTAALVVAIVAGASIVMVNILAVAHLVCRLGYWFVYYAGLGKTGGGLRTIIYVLGLLANIGLAILAAYAVWGMAAA